MNGLIRMVLVACSLAMLTACTGQSPADPTPGGPGAATSLILGAGQTETVTITDRTIITTLAREVAAAAPVPQPEPGPTLYFAQFQAGDQPVGYLHILREQPTGRVVAVRFDHEQQWRQGSEPLNKLLQPLLARVPGMKVPSRAHGTKSFG